MKIDSRVKFEEKYISKEYETTTLYFVADTSLLKELVGNAYPEADGVTFSIEFPTQTPCARFASIMMSPNKNEGNDVIIDYDWTDIDLPLSEIEELIRLAD